MIAKRMSRRSAFPKASLAAVIIALLNLANAKADPTSGDLFFTTYNGGQNVNKVAYDYDGTTFTLGNVQNIASTGGADGIVFAPDGDLLIGGQANAVHKVNPGTGTFTTKTAGGIGAFHLAVDPAGNQAYAMHYQSSGVATIPLTPFANGTAHPLNGDDLNIQTITFGPDGTAYYASPVGVGIIDLTTFTTTRKLNSDIAHGMAFDPFSGNLIAMEGDHLTQIDPDPNGWVVVGALLVPGQSFDQGSVDGKGHIFAAGNGGSLTFVDYSGTKDIDEAGNFISTKFLANFLDDVAPMVGAGAPPPTGAPDAGSTLGLLGTALASIAALRRKLVKR